MTGDPYRGQVGRCEVCGEGAVVTSQASVVGICACRRCERGDYLPALSRWGLRVARREDTCLALTWPRQWPICLRFAHERLGDKVLKLLGLGDQQLGDPSFDADIWVDYREEKPTSDLINDATVRRLISAALAGADSIELDSRQLIAKRKRESISRAGELACVALAIVVEKKLREADSQQRAFNPSLLSKVPFGRKQCRRCGEISFERTANCPCCSISNWW